MKSNIYFYTGCGWFPELNGTSAGSSRCAVQGYGGNTAIFATPADSGWQRGEYKNQA